MTKKNIFLIITNDFFFFFCCYNLPSFFFYNSVSNSQCALMRLFFLLGDRVEELGQSRGCRKCFL